MKKIKIGIGKKRVNNTKYKYCEAFLHFGVYNGLGKDVYVCPLNCRDQRDRPSSYLRLAGMKAVTRAFEN